MKITPIFTALAALISSSILVAAWDVADSDALDARSEDAAFDSLYARVYEQAALDARDNLLDELFARVIDSRPNISPSSMRGKARVDSPGGRRLGDAPNQMRPITNAQVTLDTRPGMRPSDFKGLNMGQARQRLNRG